LKEEKACLGDTIQPALFLPPPPPPPLATPAAQGPSWETLVRPWGAEE
jgi:hypothetical protein